jgi:hypothetical protein
MLCYVKHLLEWICVLEGPFPRYVPYINKRKITAFLHIHWGQKTDFVAAQPFRGRVEEDRVDEAGDTTIFWRTKSEAPGLVDAYCPLIIAYTTYIKLNWRPFLGAASHSSENSNDFLMVIHNAAKPQLNFRLTDRKQHGLKFLLYNFVRVPFRPRVSDTRTWAGIILTQNAILVGQLVPHQSDLARRSPLGNEPGSAPWGVDFVHHNPRDGVLFIDGRCSHPRTIP